MIPVIDMSPFGIESGGVAGSIEQTEERAKSELQWTLIVVGILVDRADVERHGELRLVTAQSDWPHKVTLSVESVTLLRGR